MSVECLFKVTEPSPIAACAKRATYSDPFPVVPDPESIAAPGQAAYAERLYCPGRLRPGLELFPGIGVLPGPPTESTVTQAGIL